MLNSLDNSEWMRNGDYSPNRLECQNDAVSFLFNAKVQQNPENTVGLMAMAGTSPSVQVTLTQDVHKILTALHQIKISGTSQFQTGIQIAQLALKHRQDKKQRQRIIVFVGSPIAEEEKDLVKLGKKLKKNNVSVDVISFGEDTNTTKLEAFVKAANSSSSNGEGNSHIVIIPPGDHVNITDILISTPIVQGEEGGVQITNPAAFEFGVDPSLDPELALALRISMEEENARQQAEKDRLAKEQGETKPEGEGSS